jgi:hypothetical protein
MLLAQIFPMYLDAIYVVDSDLASFQFLREGKYIAGRFPASIRIDVATHLRGAAPPHAHVFGRRGDELGVVNFDGTASHGSKFTLHQKDADALRDRGFDIPTNNLVEWTVISGLDGSQVLLLG